MGISELYLGRRVTRILQNNRIRTAEQLAALSREEALAINGFGRVTVARMRMALRRNGLSFSDDKSRVRAFQRPTRISCADPAYASRDELLAGVRGSLEDLQGAGCAGA